MHADYESELIGHGGLFMDEYNPYRMMKKIIIAH